MKIRSKVTIGLVSSLMCAAALVHAASPYKKAKAAKDEEGISFTAKAPANMTIDGKVPGVTIAQEEGDKLVFKVELEKLTTGIELRDKHTKEMLNVDKGAKFQMAVLKVPKSVSKSGNKTTGDFTLNGVTKPIEVRYKAVDAKDPKGKLVYKLTANFTIDVFQFGIKKDQICRFGVCADNKATVEAHVAVYPPGE